MKYFYTLLFCLLSLTVFAQGALSDALIQNIQQRLQNGHSPSYAIGIIDQDGPQYYLFGTKIQGGEPIDEHTIYEIGSISKTFTAILLAQMVKDGKVKLSDPVQQYLPESVKMPTWEGEAITLGHLSDHTSSLPRMPANFAPADPANPYLDYTVDQMYTFLSSYELTRPIGSTYEYSNLAQGLLGHVLARIAGKPYEELMQEVIAHPLDMNETALELNASMQERLAPGHSQGRVVSNWDFTTLAGAGAIRSSLHDMLLYIAANMGLQGSPLYSAMQLTHTERHSKAGAMRVGLGWHIAKGAEGDVIWHNGGTGGYRAFAGFVRETGKGVVVLTNSTKGADDIGFHLLNSEAKLIEIRKSMAAAIRNAIDYNEPATGWQVYEQIKETGADAYDMSEREINNLGYAYLSEDNVKAALIVFRINVDAFPESSNAYDSYGEALMKDGQKEAAIENYQKSLDLNPGNENAIKMITEMGAKPQITEAVVPEETLESYVGTYQLQPGFDIVITRKGGQLFGQATGQEKVELFPKSDTEFYLKVVEAQIAFTVEGGEVKNLILHQGGQHMPAKKIQ